MFVFVIKVMLNLSALVNFTFELGEIYGKPFGLKVVYALC